MPGVQVADRYDCGRDVDQHSVQIRPIRASPPQVRGRLEHGDLSGLRFADGQRVQQADRSGAGSDDRDTHDVLPCFVQRVLSSLVRAGTMLHPPLAGESRGMTPLKRGVGEGGESGQANRRAALGGAHENGCTRQEAG